MFKKVIVIYLLLSFTCLFIPNDYEYFLWLEDFTPYSRDFLKRTTAPGFLVISYLLALTMSVVFGCLALLKGFGLEGMDKKFISAWKSCGFVFGCMLILYFGYYIFMPMFACVRCDLDRKVEYIFILFSGVMVFLIFVAYLRTFLRTILNRGN